ncbi:hypothetical protein, partial [Saccharopolyspora erythraea]|uniref:hypothetical protein n=1 Tax=Saccharopolyspora erythraea TaxID=1836 RepID=UPI0001D30F77
ALEEARRALADGRPHTGASLGALFGKSERWGSEWLREVRAEGGLSRRDVVDATRQVALEEARRALADGRPHTGASLGALFDKSESWGAALLREVAAEGGVVVAGGGSFWG